MNSLCHYYRLTVNVTVTDLVPPVELTEETTIVSVYTPGICGMKPETAPTVMEVELPEAKGPVVLGVIENQGRLFALDKIAESIEPKGPELMIENA